jgi:hypothetical protein
VQLLPSVKHTAGRRNVGGPQEVQREKPKIISRIQLKEAKWLEGKNSVSID